MGHDVPVRLSVGIGIAVGTLTAANLLLHRVPTVAQVAVDVTLVGGLAAIASGAGLTVDEVGLARRKIPAGLRCGAVAAGLVAAGYTVAALLPMVRDAVVSDETPWSAVLLKVLVVIPLTTVLPEEFAFRGVLWGLLRKRSGRIWATVISSALFGLWHVQAALGGGSANDSIAGAIGSGPAGVALQVAGTVVFTGLAGVILCELRARSGSLVAPVLLHWAANGLGVLFVALI